VKDLVKIKNKPLVQIPNSTTVRETLKILESHEILSAPVVGAHNNLLGFVDVLDITAYIYSAWKNSFMYLQDLPHLERKYHHNPAFDVVVEKIVNFSHIDPVVTVNYSTTVKELLDIFTQPRHINRLHRVLVNEDDKITQIVSQSDIVAFATQHTDLMAKSKISLSIRDLAIIHPVLMVRADSPFYETLEILYNNRISGLALVDQLGRCVGNFSASDLRGLNEHAFDYFQGSTLQFLVKGTRVGLLGPITAPEQSSLEFAMKTLTTQHVHRIYITDNSDHPLGVLTLGDIIQVIRWKMGKEELHNVKVHA